MTGNGGETVETRESPRRRVLIVDDELGVRESLRMALKGTFDATAVGSAPDALESLAASPADVVLLDIVMPGVDGMQLLEELRGRFPNLPIIMLTATKTVKTAVHDQSPRARRPLVTLNCAAIPETLLESELFGHEKGSFTDAHARKLGQFELAHEGTLFLDEIGEMGPGTQAKLLRVLEHGEFLRVGGTKPICVDVRIIAATNRDLALGLKEGTFRADLYYRLNVVTVHLPPLRERRDDLLLLIRHFAQQKAHDMGIAEKTFKPEAVDTLMRYHWPGNVRELENLMERLLVLSEGPTIGIEELPDQVRRSEQDPGTIREQVLQGRKSLGDAVDEFERDIIVEALGQTDFNQTRAAELLGTTRRILKYRMDKLGIAAPER